ncbi:hypothetical protein YQE_11409, partial [Dendroctonus ponderosae]
MKVKNSTKSRSRIFRMMSS